MMNRIIINIGIVGLMLIISCITGCNETGGNNGYAAFPAHGYEEEAYRVNHFNLRTAGGYMEFSYEEMWDGSARALAVDSLHTYPYVREVLVLGKKNERGLIEFIDHADLGHEMAHLLHWQYPEVFEDPHKY